MLASSRNKPTSLHRLLHAAKNNHLERIEQLIESKEISLSDINHQNTKGQSALIFASAYSNETIVDFLLKNGADPNITDNSGNNALLLIIGSASPYKNKKTLNIHLKIIANLISAGTNLEHRNKNNRSALMMVMFCKTHVDSIYLLLDRLQLNFIFNKDIDASSKTFAGFLLYLDSLIDREQIKNIPKEGSTNYGEALYQISEEEKPIRDFIEATEKRFYSTADLLLSEKDIHPLRYLNNIFFLQQQGAIELDGNTPSHIAVNLRSTDSSCLSLLINAEKNLNHRNYSNQSILMLALVNAVQNGDPVDSNILFLILETIHKKLLLNTKVTILEKKFYKFKSYINSFIDAVKIREYLSGDQIKFAESLISDLIMLLRTKILKAIFTAATNGDAHTLFTLLACEETNCRDAEGNTPLFKAILYEESNCREAKKNCPLFDSIHDHPFPIVKTLVEEHKASLTTRNHADKTPLSLACDLKHYPIINYLLEKIDEKSIETVLLNQIEPDQLSPASKEKFQKILNDYHTPTVTIPTYLEKNVLLFKHCTLVKYPEVLNDGSTNEPESELKLKLDPF